MSCIDDNGELRLPEEISLTSLKNVTVAVNTGNNGECSKKAREGRNWTKQETNLFCNILADSTNNFFPTLEKKALKKSKTKEVFDDVLEIFSKELERHDFKASNNTNFSNKIPFVPLNMDYKKLQTKYNNLKSEWRKINDKKKPGSGRSYESAPTRFEIINPILCDSNKGLEDVVSSPTETSYLCNVEVKRTVAADRNESDGDESSLLESDANEEEHPQNHSTPIAGKLVAKPHVKRGYVRSQTRAMSQLVASVNKLAEVSAKKTKMEHQGRLDMLQFIRDEHEKN